MSYQDRKKGNRQLVRGRVWRALGGVFALNVLFSSLVVGLFVGYLAISNSAAANGFAVRDLEKKIEELRNQSDRLNLQVVAMQSMNSVEEQIGVLGFVPIEDIDYISAAPAIVAVK
jgi:hypothetical protein